MVKGGAKDAAKRDQTRANKESGDRMTSGGHIGGPFKVTPNPAFLDSRSAYFDTLWEIQQKSVEQLQASSDLSNSISITLPDGSVKEGIAFKTSPYDIAKAISQGLADSIIIAKVCYSSRLDGDFKVVQVDDEAEEGMIFLTHFDSYYIILHSPTHSAYVWMPAFIFLFTYDLFPFVDYIIFFYFFLLVFLFSFSYYCFLIILLFYYFIIFCFLISLALEL